MPKYKMEFEIDPNEAVYQGKTLGARIARFSGKVVYTSFKITGKTLVFIVFFPVKALWLKHSFPGARIEEYEED